MSHSFLILHDLHTDRQQGRAGGAGGAWGGVVEVSGNQRWSGRATPHLRIDRTAHKEQWPSPGSISSGQTNECGGSE